MHSSDFSIAFLESLAADMRALHVQQLAPASRIPTAAKVVTFVSALLTLMTFRWV